MEHSSHYEEIKDDFNREAEIGTMFSKNFTQADDKIIKYLQRFISPNWKVCELACGMGNVIENLNCHQTAMDISEKMLEKCDIIQKYVGNFDDTQFQDKEFDLVFMCFGLQQSENPELTLQEMERIGKRVIIFDGDDESGVGLERRERMASGDWETCGKARWFTKSFFNKLGYKTESLLPHVLIAKKI